MAGFGDEEPADDGRDHGDGDRVDEPGVDVAVRIPGWIEEAQVQTEEGSEARLTRHGGGHETRVDEGQPAAKLTVAEVIRNRQHPVAHFGREELDETCCD